MVDYVAPGKSDVVCVRKQRVPVQNVTAEVRILGVILQAVASTGVPLMPRLFVQCAMATAVAQLAAVLVGFNKDIANRR